MERVIVSQASERLETVILLVVEILNLAVLTKFEMFKQVIHL